VHSGADRYLSAPFEPNGINILASTTLDGRALLIIAVSLALGLGVSQVPEFLAHMPAALRNVLESGVATGGICAVLLNWFLPTSPGARTA
jgi:xanthine permease XanP